MKAPLRRGFGTTLIEQSIRAEGGQVVSTYRQDGVTWEIEMPLPSIEVTELQRRIASASRPAELAPQPAQSPRPLAGRRLLVVEDEALVAIELVSMLEEAGASVIGPVGSVAEALAVAASGDFDAAFLDGNLHGRPVHEVASALTKAGTPFVFVSGYGRESLPTGFAHIDIVGKPFTIDQVLTAARSMLSVDATVTVLKAAKAQSA